MLDIAFAKPALPKSGALVLLVSEGENPSGLWQQADEATGGAIARAFWPRPSSRARRARPAPSSHPVRGCRAWSAVGLGKPAELTQLILNEAGGHAAASLSRETAAGVAADALQPAQAAEVALGAVLRTYRFDRYRTKEKPEDKPKLAKLTLFTDDPARAKAAWEPLEGVAKGVFLSRDLVSEPPNVLNPAEMADRCRKLADLGLKVEVLGPKEMTKLGFGALLGVSQGSVNEPRMVVMQWHGGSGDGRKGKGKPVAFIGKGVTFDTGGISIKPAGGMEDMKWDMAGAGTVIGLMAALAGRKAKVDAVGSGRAGGEHALRQCATAGRRGEELLRPDDRGDQHRRRGPAGSGGCAVVLPGEIRSALHGRSRDADRRDDRRTRPRVCRDVQQRRRSWRRSCPRRARRPAKSCGACRWAMPTTS